MEGVGCSYTVYQCSTYKRLRLHYMQQFTGLNSQMHSNAPTLVLNGNIGAFNIRNIGLTANVGKISSLLNFPVL